MARIRTIKPDAFRSETLSEVSIATERTFFGLICECDDKGRFKERPAVLNGALWPLRPEHTVRDMEHDLNELVRVGLLCRYVVDGITYLHLPTLKKHQVINRPTATKNPACPTCHVDEGGSRTDDGPAEPVEEDRNVLPLTFPSTGR